MSSELFDVIVVGGGHAGCEAALAVSRLGGSVGVVTFKLDRLAQMSCNPAIGGVGKGHLVREVDALGGAMGMAADATGIQYKTLNTRRGAAARSTRCQSDSKRYREWMGAKVLGSPGIVGFEGEVLRVVPKGKAFEIHLREGTVLYGRSVVITTGTFLNGTCFVGDERFSGGRFGDKAAIGLSDSLRSFGIELGRFKTGTTPRLAQHSIKWDELEPQWGDTPRPRFSFKAVGNDLPQIACRVAHTTQETHDIVEANLHRSPLFQGAIEGTGPRYCPSLEDKIVRFSERKSHHVFLEPEDLESGWVYPNGLSTSLPKDVQDAFLRSIRGLEDVQIHRYGYAVEYDYADPRQLYPSLMSKNIDGLFCAGQLNGTSGYEEAAAQGLMAGLNAFRYVKGLSDAVLSRSEAYIGVLIDDLVTKGVDEPYRMFTGRAEHRLVLRESNAEARLLDYAKNWELVSGKDLEEAEERKARSERLRVYLNKNKVGAELIQALGVEDKDGTLQGMTRETFLRHPTALLEKLVEEEEKAHLEPFNDLLWLEDEIKFAGYIEREKLAIARLAKLESITLDMQADYKNISGLSNEIREKLVKIRPANLGQASRIPGITPTALTLLQMQRQKALAG